MKRPVEIEPECEHEIIGFGVFHGRRVLAAIRKQLPLYADVPSRHRKQLRPIPEYSHLEPVWQLSVGEHRIHYRVEPFRNVVIVFHAFRKGRETTEESR